MNWETVAIPLAQGIKPTSQARVLDQQRLLTAQNCFFEQDEGPRKRYGHLTRPVKTAAVPVGLNGIVPPEAAGVREPFGLGDPGLSAYWLHGYGLLNPTDLPATYAGGFAVSAQAGVGHVFGQLARDAELVQWDGFRALSCPSNPVGIFGEVGGQGVFPALRSAPIAKTLDTQLSPDAADNGVVRTVAWLHSGDLHYSVYDSLTGAALISDVAVAVATASFVRVFTLGAWTHMLVPDLAINELLLRSFHQDTPQTLVSRSLGAVETSACVDVAKVDETRAVLAFIEAGVIHITEIDSGGAVRYAFDPDMGVASGADTLGIAVSPRGHIALAFVDGTSAYFGAYQAGGAALLVPTVMESSLDGGARITMAPNWLEEAGGGASDCFTVYIEDEAPSSTWRRVRSYTCDWGGDVGVQHGLRHNVALGSHAFRVGQRAYTWLCSTPTLYELQPTWFLVDEQCKPVGKMLFGLAYVPDPTTQPNLPGVNWCNPEGAPAKDLMVFSGALGYRQRATSAQENTDPNGVWQEPSIQFYQLDFLPKLRSAQAGRSTYIAGAQLWAYDGSEFAEAGFHMAPEGVAGVVSVGTGLSASKKYRYRVDLCAKNAQNEEIRSFSLITEEFTTTPSDCKITLTVPTMSMTRRDSYLLVYRTEGDGTEYYLVSSRNPADVGLAENRYLAQDQALVSVSFVDVLPDADLIAREYHPANAPTYVQPFSAPACELVASGRDRLWLAGGELAAGEVAPSRLFYPGEVPTFSPALNLQVDRNAEPITAVGFVGEVAAFFRRTTTYVLESDGPDNVLQGGWGSPRLALADVGAVSQESLALAGEGLYFQSPAGFRVLQPGGGLRPPGAGLIGGLGTDVDTIATGDYTAVVVPKHSQIRWYSRRADEPTLVVDYTKNVWTTWTGLDCVGAHYWPALDTVGLARGNAEVWMEEEGSYMDGDRTYEMVIRSAWFHAGSLGDFQRLRRWAVFGGAEPGLTLRYRLYYNERSFHGEEGLVEFNGNTNTSEWGDSTWGGGSWGDAANPYGQSDLWFRDNVFRLRKRTARQKCSVVSIEFSDLGGAVDFAPAVIALELGRKIGLDRNA